MRILKGEDYDEDALAFFHNMLDEMNNYNSKKEEEEKNLFLECEDIKSLERKPNIQTEIWNAN